MLWSRSYRHRAAARIQSCGCTWPHGVVSSNGGMLHFFLQHPSMLACCSDMATSCCLIFQLCARRIPGACSFWAVCALIFTCFRATSRFRRWLPFACIAFSPIPGTSLLRRFAETPNTLSIPLIALTREVSSHAIVADLSGPGWLS